MEETSSNLIAYCKSAYCLVS